MNTLAQRLSSNWPLVHSLLAAGFLSALGLAFWVMRTGGKQRFMAWVLQLESSDQDNAAERIMSGLKALNEKNGSATAIDENNNPATACFDFIGGLDQWRAVQIRIAQRSNRIHRSGSAICIFLAFTAAVYVLYIFGAPITWTAVCVTLSAIAFAWFVWNAFPLAYMAWHKGIPKELPANPSPNTSSQNRAGEVIHQ